VGFRALILRHLLQIPYVKDLVKRLKRDPRLRRTCGYGERAPKEDHFSQMKRRIGAEGFRIIEAYLRRKALRLRASHAIALNKEVIGMRFYLLGLACNLQFVLDFRHARSAESGVFSFITVCPRAYAASENHLAT
jgi:hypothetical protein